MKRTITCLGLLLASQLGHAQQIINSWMLNTTGATGKYWEVVMGTPTGNLINTGSLANCQSVCYTMDSVWVECTGLAEVMGPYLNPGAPTDQDYTFRFPRVPQPETSTHTTTPVVFAVGLLINGVPAYGNSNASSYNPPTSTNSNMGQGIWNVDAYYAEGMVLDSTFSGHPQQMGAYHSHAIPESMYPSTSSAHSPLIGWAFDGYPIYGPYGYSNPSSSSSSITRMRTSYQLRSITTRTTLPDGSTLPPPNYGPAVSGTFPLGMYIEDYAFVSGLGDLDKYNGRTCVTPEFPAGTYAYFTTMTAAGLPAFPYYIGEEYYGVTVDDNLNPNTNITIPAATSCMVTTMDKQKADLAITVFPNPSEGVYNVTWPGANKTAVIEVFDSKGALVMTQQVSGNSTTIDLVASRAGIYLMNIRMDNGKQQSKLIQKN